MEGVSYLRSLLGDLPAAKLDKIDAVTQELGGLSLALSQIAAYIGTTQCFCSEFISRYQKRLNPKDINKRIQNLVDFDYTFWAEDRLARCSFPLHLIYLRLENPDEATAFKKKKQNLSKKTIMGSASNENDSLKDYDDLVFYVHGYILVVICKCTLV